MDSIRRDMAKTPMPSENAVVLQDDKTHMFALYLVQPVLAHGNLPNNFGVLVLNSICAAVEKDCITGLGDATNRNPSCANVGRVQSLLK